MKAEVLEQLEPHRVELCKDCPQEERVDLIDQAITGAGHEGITWHAHLTLTKYHGDFQSEAEAIAAGMKPYETLEVDGNILVNNGINLLLDGLRGTAITVFSNANARIGVGDSTTAAANTQTDLQASTNKLRKAMDATYPTISGSAPWILTFKSTFASADANYAWQEWAIFNAASGATSMLNRKVESMGTKSAGQTWVLTATIGLS